MSKQFGYCFDFVSAPCGGSTLYYFPLTKPTLNAGVACISPLVKSKTLLCLQLVTVDADVSTCKYSYMTRACHTIINHVEMLSSCTHRKPYFLSLQSTVQVCYQLAQAMVTESCSLSGHRVHPCRHETLILQYKKS